MYDKVLKKGRRFAIACLIFVWISPAWGQAVFFIRDVKQSIVLEEFNDVINQFVLSPYGEVSSLLEQNQPLNTYSFQGQEYDKELGMYFFPARLYLSHTKRFLQPDPKSQYFSAYSYVNGDPVNYLDLDGKEGSKILFLYTFDHKNPGGKEPDTADLIGELSGDYDYPLTDFVNGKVTDLPEWNGKVFLYSHTNTKSGKVEVERNAAFPETLKFKRGNIENSGIGNVRSQIEGSELGEYLKEFAQRNNVSLRSITVGSCESQVAAESLAKGIHVESGKTTNQLEISAFKKNRSPTMVTPGNFKESEGYVPVERPRYYVTRGEGIPNYYEGTDGKIYFDDLYYANMLGYHKNPYVEGDELHNFLRGNNDKFLEDMVKMKVAY